MANLKDRFDSARTNILNRPLGGMASPCSINALSDILREANGDGSTEFKPDSLSRHGIDPLQFRETQAINFAKKTLDWHDNPGAIYQETLINRCKTCLDTAEPMSFGNMLPLYLREEIEKKLERNGAPRTSSGPSHSL